MLMNAPPSIWADCSIIATRAPCRPMTPATSLPPVPKPMTIRSIARCMACPQVVKLTMLVQESPDQFGDLGAVCFEVEETGVEKVQVGGRQVGAERFCTCGAEDFVEASPGEQRGWLVCAEVLVEGGVEVEVELVVPQQLQLHQVVAGA